jgi:hypothetical protein
MSITTIARQAQWMRAGEVITKLAKDAYFMRVDNRVAQVPPVRTCQPDNEATSRSPADNKRNRTRGELLLTPTVLRHRLVHILRVATVPAAPAVTAMLFLIAILVAEAAAAGAPHTGLAGEPVAGVTAGAEATRTATPPVSHVVATLPAKKLKNYDAKSPPRQATTTSSPPSLLGFAICFSRRNSNPCGSPSMMRSKI